MALEQLDKYNFQLEPGLADVHTHPRIFDVINLEEFVPGNRGREGKAGLMVYTEVALESGITLMIAMPNESLRRFDKNAEDPEKTLLIPYPIATYDRLLAAESLISHEANIPTALHFGVDPRLMFLDHDKQILDREGLYRHFTSAREECMSLKLYGAKTTGGYNIEAKHIPTVAKIWHDVNPEKPVVLHLEDDNIAKVLAEINQLEKGKDIPIHIAHVSSKQELEAVIAAKEAGMNITCEVTPHHLFMNDIDGSSLAGYGCMKPTLKSQEDVDFLWSHLTFIDMIASDCAPHRKVDKEAVDPAYGVTNHKQMLPLLLGAIADGKLSYEQLYQMLCIAPRKRFNLPQADGSITKFNIHQTENGALHDPERYGYSPFKRLNRQFHLVGNVVEVKAGRSHYNAYAPSTFDVWPSYTHLVRPDSLAA